MSAKETTPLETGWLILPLLCLFLGPLPTNHRWLLKVTHRPITPHHFGQDHGPSGISLVLQWLRLCLPMQKTRVWSLIRELRSHMLCGTTKKKNNNTVLAPSLFAWGNLWLTSTNSQDEAHGSSSTYSKVLRKKWCTDFELWCMHTGTGMACIFQRPTEGRWAPKKQSHPMTRPWFLSRATVKSGQRLLYLKWIPKRTYCMAQGTLLNVTWQPGWEGSLLENGYMYMYSRVPSLFTWNYYKIVNWLNPSTK